MAYLNPFPSHNAYVVGSSEAPRVHGFNVAPGHTWLSAPRFKNQFFVHFQMRPQSANFGGLAEQKEVTYKVISVDAPKFSIETETLHQYNKRRIVPTKINFDPINITMHDDRSNHVQKFWKEIYSFYFKDGIGKTDENGTTKYREKASTRIAGGANQPKGYDGFGFHLGNKEEYPNLFSHISLYLVAGGRHTRIDMVNPYLTAFSHDSFDQNSPNELASCSMTFQPETITYVYEQKDNADAPVLKSFLGLNDNKEIFNHYSQVDTLPKEPADTKVDTARKFGQTQVDLERFSKQLAEAGDDSASRPRLVENKKKILNSWSANQIDTFEGIVDGFVLSPDYTDYTDFAGGSFEAMAAQVKEMAPHAEERQSEVFANEMLKATTPGVDDFGELGSATASITSGGAVPSTGDISSLGNACKAIQGGASASASGLASSVGNALGAGGGGIAGTSGSLLGGMVPASARGTVSNISSGGFLPNVPGLGQGLSVLTQAAGIMNTVNQVTGGNVFGKFSTGANTIGNVARALQTGSLRNAALEVGRTRHFNPQIGRTASLIDAMVVANSNSNRLSGSNFNNAVVSSSRTASKPWVNPDTLGNKTQNTVIASASVDTFNDTFGPATPTQNANVSIW